jgi:peptide/nickel transport system substrate-binding protein
MSTRKNLTRREFLQLTGGLAAAATLAACAPAATTAPTAPTTAPAVPTKAAAATSAPAATAVATSKYKEAPTLAEQVKAGKLPAVEQRLPKNPKVITPNEKVGVYGGRWRSGMLGKSDTPWLSRTIGNDPLLRWAPDIKSVLPNLAEKWEISSNGLEYTFYLIQGVKWSDGTPLTADDFMYWYEDVILSDDLTKVKPTWIKSAGKVGKLVKVDQFVVKFVFESPNGLLIRNLAGGSGNFWQPAAYMKQWHIKYNKDKVEAAVKELKMQDWMALYALRNDQWANPDRPTTNGWMIIQGTTDTSQVLARRNPYYWKVDTEGNQLPYIDETQYPIVDKIDALVLKALNGEVDMMDRNIATPDNKAVFTDNKAKGGYDFFTVKTAFECPCVVAFNLNHKDPGIKEVFMKKDFRIAMSYAINRKEIIDTLYVGDGSPSQPAPLPESPHYHERLEKQYTEYDVAKANKLLDDLGLKKGSDGFRLRLDGKPLFFTIECALAFEPWPQTLEMLVKYWKAVGVNCTSKSYERALFYQRKAAYDHDAGVWTGADSMQVVMDPRWSLPFSNESIYGIAWADWWNSGGKLGEEPPDAAKQQQKLYETLVSTPDDAKQKEIMKQILDIAADNFWCMGISRYYKGYGIIKNNFKNLPKEVWAWHLCNSPAQTMPEQYYFAKA